MGKRVKIPQSYVPAQVVHADDLEKCRTFEPQSGARVRGEQATLPLNKVVRLNEPVTMEFFGGGSVTLEGRVCLRAYGSPSSFGTVELLDVPD